MSSHTKMMIPLVFFTILTNVIIAYGAPIVTIVFIICCSIACAANNCSIFGIVSSFLLVTCFNQRMMMLQLEPFRTVTAEIMIIQNAPEVIMFVINQFLTSIADESAFWCIITSFYYLSSFFKGMLMCFVSWHFSLHVLGFLCLI